MEKIDKAALDRLRADTTGCSQVIHFNNAGASLLPDVVVGDGAVTTELEYVTGLIGLADARKTGVKVCVVAHDKDGRFPLEQLEAAITANTKLIAVTHIPSSGGGMLPVQAIGEIARRHGVLPGWLPVAGRRLRRCTWSCMG